MSMISVFNIARSALLAYQRSLDVTAHNVANAETPGYSRQRVDLTAAMPLQTPSGLIGRGVTAEGVDRVRNQLHDQTFRRENGLLGHSQTLSTFLSSVEAAFQEPSDQSLGATLDALFNAFSELANDPSSLAARSLVSQAGQNVSRQFQGLDAHLAGVRNQATSELGNAVTRVNQLTQDIANLNGEIRIAQASGGAAPDLEDRRDVLLDALSGLVDVGVQQRSDGSVSITAGGSLLLDGRTPRQLEVRAVGGGLEVGFVGGAPIAPSAGEVGGLLELLNTEIPTLQTDLDTLANALVTELNALHQTGFNALGATGVDFFDAAGVTAGTITLSAAVVADPNAIAAGGTTSPGDNAVALQIAALRSVNVGSLGGQSLDGFYTGVVTTLGAQVHQANANQSAAEMLVNRAEIMRASVSGVSIDEEVVAMITQQNAFAAAARLVTVADEMIQEVLRMV